MPTTLSAREVHNAKRAPHIEGVLSVFHERWSPRSFSDREVSRQSLIQIFEAARWAASSSNEQPWRFIVGLRGSETHKKIRESLAGFNQQWAPAAPVLILGTAHSKFSRNGAENRFALYDLGAAASYLVLQAASMGLAAHQMGGFDQEKARELLGIPADYLIGAVIAVGYQDEPEKLADQTLIERELAPRQRKPLSEIVYEAWEKPLPLG